MASHGERAGRPKGRGLASAQWLSVVFGLSCSVSVPLPGAKGESDGGGTDGPAVLDVSEEGAKGPSDGPDQCGPNAHYQQVSVLPSSVEMIIALDRSSSMETNTFGTTTRLQAAQEAIKKMAGDHPGIRFGLDLFPLSSSNCGGNELKVTPAFNGLAGIDHLVCGSGDGGCLPNGPDSPSHLALRDSVKYFGDLGSKGSWSQAVLLITDRDPICASNPSYDLCTTTMDFVSKSGNIWLFIVALTSDKASTNCLSKMASATNPFLFANPPERFSPVPNQDDLGNKLDAIAVFFEQSLCQFMLMTQQHVPDNPDQVVVSINGAPVQHGTADGWSIDHNVLVLSGSSCDAIKFAQNTPNVTVATCSSPDAGGSGAEGPHAGPG